MQSRESGAHCLCRLGDLAHSAGATTGTPELLYEADWQAEKIAADLALPEAFVEDVLERYASEQNIAASNRRRKVVNIQSGVKWREKNRFSCRLSAFK